MTANLGKAFILGAALFTLIAGGVLVVQHSKLSKADPFSFKPSITVTNTK